MAYACLTGDAHVTIIQDKGYWRFWIEVELIMAYYCSKFNPYSLSEGQGHQTKKI